MHLLPQSLKSDWHWLVEHRSLTQEKLPAQLLSSQHPFSAMHFPLQGFVAPAQDHWH